MDRQDAKIDAIREDIGELRTDLAVLRERTGLRPDDIHVTKKDKVALTVAGGGFGAFLVAVFQILGELFNKKLGG